MSRRVRLVSLLAGRLFAPSLLLDAGQLLLTPDKLPDRKSPRQAVAAVVPVNVHLAKTGGQLVLPSLQHSLDMIEKAVVYCYRSIHHLLLIFMRSAHLAATFAPSVLLSPLLLDDPLSQTWWDIFRDAIRRSGPCVTKLAQWIATRPDLFPLSVCLQLQDLQSMRRHASYSRAQIELLLRRELQRGNRFRDIALDGSDAELVTLGSGCIAQVVRGRLRQKDGTTSAVAVKVVHPDLQETIETDMDILAALVYAVEGLVPGLGAFSLKQSVSEFASLMRSQLDMDAEARNLRQFRRNFGWEIDHDLPASTAKSAPVRLYSPYIGFPQAFLPYCSQHVLVEEFVEGALISEVLADTRTSEAERRALGDLGLTAILKMVFQDNLFHADLHPGNIICQRISSADANTEDGILSAVLVKVQRLVKKVLSTQSVTEITDNGNQQFKIVLIDAGLTASLDREDRRNFIDLFHAVVTNDGARAGQLMIDRSSSHSCLRPEQFNATMQQIIEEVHRDGLALKNVSVGRLLQQVLVACYQHQVKLEPKFVSLVLALGVMEGLGQRLDPDVNILLKATPWVLQAVLAEYRQAQTKSK